MVAVQKVITMTAWRRSDYFKQVIDSLKSCEGIEDYFLIVAVDADYPKEQKEMERILNQSGLNHLCLLREQNYGCAKNTLDVLKRGFKQADRVIHVEDDTVLHPLALRWFEHNLERFEHDERIFSVSGYVNGDLNANSLDGDWTESNIVGIRDDFNCWGWATWKRVWDEIGDKGFGITWKEGFNEHNCGEGKAFLSAVNREDKGSWAWPMRKYWRQKRFEIAPHTSFIQNIGLERGVWATKEIFLYKSHTDWFSPEKTDAFPLDYFFVDDFLNDLGRNRR